MLKLEGIVEVPEVLEFVSDLVKAGLHSGTKMAVSPVGDQRKVLVVPSDVRAKFFEASFREGDMSQTKWASRFAKI